MSLANIKTAIINKLESVSYLNNVYGYETGKESGHSYATVTKLRVESEFGDTIRNVNDWYFSVKLYTSQNIDIGPETAESVSDGMVDEVLNAFHMDTTLSGTCKYIEPIDAEFGYAEGPEPMRFADITLKATEVFNIDTGTID